MNFEKQNKKQQILPPEKRGREGGSERDRQTDRQTETETQRHRGRERHRDRERVNFQIKKKSSPSLFL